MTYEPKFQRQLDRDGSTDEVDCGPRSWQMLLDYQSRGELRPGPSETRKRADCGNGPTNVDDAKRAVESYDPKGRKPLVYYRKTRTEDVKAAVRNGKAVHLCIDYGVINDRSEHTGDPAFRGSHSVLALGWREVDGGAVQWRIWDPLMDGRRDGIAQGPVWIKQAIMVDACETLGGGPGKCYAGVGGGGQKP
jgi:hypothetical protein